MKKITFLLLILISQLSYSQNWAPINFTEKFCYSSDDTLDIINHVLWVDSIDQDGDVQLFHLNKIAIPFQDGYGSEFLFNQPQFLLDDILIYPNGEWVFEDTFFLPIEDIESFTLIPNSEILDSWNFTDDITASISEVGTEILFGVVDSVKTIQLSDNTEILLSKNYGIVQWKNQYQLIGIEGRNLGVLVPDFDDMFAKISPGDVICYNNGRWQADETVTGWNSSIRMDIETITRYDDSIVFHAYVRSNTDYFWKDESAKSTNGYEDIVIHKSRFTDVYPNDTLAVSWDLTPMDGIVISKLDKHKWGGIKKTQHLVENDWMDYMSVLTPCEGLYSYELCAGDYSDYLLVEHSVDYGFLEYFDSGFEWGGEETLVGIIDNGDTLGIIYPVDMFVGNQEINSNSNVVVYPSPARENLYIHFQEAEDLKWSIFSISGQVVAQGTKENSIDNFEINIGHLPVGVFIIQLELNGQLIKKKFIKAQ